MIEYAKSLKNTPIQYFSCFISYSHKDDEFAKRIYADLHVNNVRCWLATEDMKTGDKIRPTIDESIRIHDKLLLIRSELLVQSNWVEHETEHALDLETYSKKGFLIRYDWMMRSWISRQGGPQMCDDKGISGTSATGRITMPTNLHLIAF
jgi:hypothetical protein